MLIIIDKVPNAFFLLRVSDKFVKKQLEKLRDSHWEDSVHYDVLQKLKSTCGPRIIAKLVDYFINI